MLLIFLILIACIVLVLFVFILTTSLRTGVVPMPSLRNERMVVSNILKEYPDIQTIVDLGSGWGGLVRYLALRIPDRKIIGVEKSLVPHLFSGFSAFPFWQRYYQGRVSHEQGDLYTRKIENRQACITYLSGPAMKKLRESFERDRPTGSILISIAFAMPGWTPVRIEYAEGVLHSAVYVYEL
ncbi:MAG: hypothetical protein JEY99_19120 [Spirochaetales bacterium]|nr:hypothetical protein [Spirochaetales bacterium]